MSVQRHASRNYSRPDIRSKGRLMLFRTTPPGQGSVMRCANAACAQLLDVDHVTLVTTCHVRRFCCVECIAEGQRSFAHVEGGVCSPE